MHVRRPLIRHPRTRGWILLLPLLAALLVCAVYPPAAHAAPANLPATSTVLTNISGVEISSGVRVNGTTYGVTFTGWDRGAGLVPNGWQGCPFLAYCGSWVVVISYRGTPGIGHTVTITGGTWTLTLPNLHTYAGSISSGHVAWPATLSASMGCGTGVGRAAASLSFLGGGTGSLAACLDDTHLSRVFPPHIWGTVIKN